MNQLRERRLEEKARRRAEILDAAETVAASVGAAAMSMDMVARQARLSRALLYVYFADKFDLNVALCERALQLLRRRMQAATARHRRGIDQVAACGRAYVAFAHRYPVYFEVVSLFQAHAPGSHGRRDNEAACKTCGDAVHAVTVAALRRGVTDGSIRRDLGDPALAAVTLWGFMHGIIQLTTTKSAVLAEDGISVRRLVDHAVELCLRSLAPARGSKR